MIYIIVKKVNVDTKEDNILRFDNKVIYHISIKVSTGSIFLNVLVHDSNSPQEDMQPYPDT